MARDLVRLSVRLSPRTHALLKREAQIEGIGISAFIREAALARAYYAIAQRKERPAGEEGELFDAIRTVMREQDARHHRRPPADGT